MINIINQYYDDEKYYLCSKTDFTTDRIVSSTESDGILFEINVSGSYFQLNDFRWESIRNLEFISYI